LSRCQEKKQIYRGLEGERYIYTHNLYSPRTEVV